ncbi:MAG: hypothetical protein WCT08_02105 [Patescibacteria group bacterium]|jgi:hypothetical protein
MNRRTSNVIVVVIALAIIFSVGWGMSLISKGIPKEADVLSYRVHTVKIDGETKVVVDYFVAVGKEPPFDTLTEQNFPSVRVNDALPSYGQKLCFWQKDDGSLDTIAVFYLPLGQVEHLDFEERHWRP